MAQISHIGTEGGAPVLPAGLPLRDNETVVITEAFFDYQPVFFPVIEPIRHRRTAFNRPRIGALQSID